MKIKVKVTVTVEHDPGLEVSGQMVEELEFDDVNIFHRDGGFGMVHRDAMVGAPAGLWPKVAFAANVVAERGVDALFEGLQQDRERQNAVDRLLERLQSGSQPWPDDPELEDIRQITLVSWSFADALSDGLTSSPEEFLIGQTPDGRTETDEILWIDPKFRWALCAHAFFWLGEVNG